MQLIASILAAMQNYWANVFFLPKTVTNDIDRLLKDFLWSQGEKVKGKAKIAETDNNDDPIIVKEEEIDDNMVVCIMFYLIQYILNNH